MKKKWKIAIGIFVGIFFLAYIFTIFLLFKGPSKRFSGFRKNGIALISINGVISSSSDSPGYGSATPENIIEQLNMADDDPSVAAILLRINSPGGTAGSSQEIFSRVKTSKKPVVASIGDIGASGAYWIASAADEIVANGVSEVGSIGVIISIPNIKGLLDKTGAELQIIKKGKFKDIGNPARPLTDEEKDILSRHSEIIYREFISNIAKSRKLDVKKVEELATGLTFPGVEAKKLGLIDTIGNFDNALAIAGRLGGIKGKPNIVSYDKPGIFDIIRGLPGIEIGIRSMIDNMLATDNAATKMPVAN